MGLLSWIQLGFGAVGAALLLLHESMVYRERMIWGSDVWWAQGAHDEVQMYPKRMYGPWE